MFKKSKLLSLVLAFALVLGCTATAAFAAGSGTASGLPEIQDPNDPNATDHYIVTELSNGQDYQDLQKDHTQALKAIEDYNSNHDVNALINAIKALPGNSFNADQLSNYKFATDFFDTDKTGPNVPMKDGKYRVLYKLNSLPTGSKASVLHYNLETKQFELIPLTQTAEGWEALFSDLSPTAFTLLVEDSGNNGDNGNGGTGTVTPTDNNNGSNANASKTSSTTNTAKTSTSGSTSPKTGDASDWMLWMAAAVVLAGSSVVALRRKEN